MSPEETHQDLTISRNTLPILEPTDLVGKAIPHFEKGHDVILIVEPNGSFHGIVNDRDMLKKHANANTTMKTLSRSVPTLSAANEDPVKVTRMMMNADTRVIPILDEYNRIQRGYIDLGVIQTIFSQGLVDDTKIGSIADRSPVVCNQKDTLGRVVSLTRDHSLPGIPVIDNNKNVTGIITARNLCKEILHPRHATTMGDIIGQREASWVRAKINGLIIPSPFIPPETTCLEAAKIMEERRTPVLIVAPLETATDGFGTIVPRDIMRHIIVVTMTEGYSVVVTGAPDNFVYDLAIQKAQRLVDHEAGYLGETGNIHVRFKKVPYQSKRGLWQYECAVRIQSSKGHIIAVETADFGGEKAMNGSFHKLTRMINSRKGAAKDSRRRQSLRKARG